MLFWCRVFVDIWWSRTGFAFNLLDLTVVNDKFLSRKPQHLVFYERWEQIVVLNSYKDFRFTS